VRARDQALSQMFLSDPINSSKVEFNFAAKNANRAGRRLTRTAADAKEQPVTSG
jgi:hypothetical protein